MTAKFPDDADWATCADMTLQELCNAITQRHDLPNDIRDLLHTAAATLAVGIAFSHKDQGARALVKKFRARCRKAM